MRLAPRTLSTNREASVSPQVIRGDDAAQKGQNGQTGNDPTTGLGFNLCSEVQGLPALEGALLCSLLTTLVVMMVMVIGGGDWWW